MLLSYSAPATPPAPSAAIQARQPSEILDDLKRRMATLKAIREDGGWMQHWRDLQEHILLRRGRFLCTAGPANKTRHLNRTILSHIPAYAAGRCATGMTNGLTSKARLWFNFTVSDPKLASVQSVQAWLADCERMFMQWLDTSNFYTVVGQVYLELCVFGTAAMVVLEDFDKLFRCEMLTVGEYCLANNKAGSADTLFREYECTVGQVVEQFGLENCSEPVQRAYKAKEHDQTLTVCHAIESNRDRMPGREDAAHLPYRNVYWEKAAPAKDRFLKYSGFHEQALFAPRWDVSGNDAYGGGPGTPALPECRQLYHELRRKSMAFDRTINPPMGAPASLKQAGANLLPGSVNYLEDLDAAQFRSLYESYNPRLQELMQDIEALSRAIEAVFFNPLFFPISLMEGKQPRQNLEVAERKAEMLSQLGPFAERFESEFLEPFMERIWGIAVRAGVLPEPPREVAGKPIKTVFVGPLALAQKASEVMSIERLVAFVGNMAESFPEASDKLNTDQIVTQYAELINTAPTILRSEEETAAIRANREAVRQQQAAADAAPAIAQVAKGAQLLSETDAGGGRSGLQAVDEAL